MLSELVRSKLDLEQLVLRNYGSELEDSKAALIVNSFGFKKPMFRDSFFFPDPKKITKADPGGKRKKYFSQVFFSSFKWFKAIL